MNTQIQKGDDGSLYNNSKYDVDCRRLALLLCTDSILFLVIFLFGGVGRVFFFFRLVG
jgi:hypothetical protein